MCETCGLGPGSSLVIYDVKYLRFALCLRSSFVGEALLRSIVDEGYRRELMALEALEIGPSCAATGSKSPEPP